MGGSSREARPKRTTRPGRLRRWLGLGFALNVSVGMAYSVVTLRHQADDLRQVEVLLSTLDEQASTGSRLLWWGVGSGQVPSGVPERRADNGRAIRSTLEALAALEADVAPLDGVAAAARRHERVLDTQLSLLADGHVAEVRRRASVEAERALGDLHDAMATARALYGQEARHVYRVADVESLLMMAVGALMAGLLFRSFERARRSADLRASAERTRSENRFRSLVQNASDVVTVVAADGSVVYQTPSVERVLGYPVGVLDGTDLGDLVHPDDAERATAVLDEVRRGPAAGEAVVECRVRHRDGSWRYVQNLLCNLLDDPAIEGIVVTTRDVTESRVAELAVRDSEAKFRLVAQSASEAIVSADVDGNIVFWNNAAAAIFGYRDDEVLGRPLSILMPARYVAAHQAGIRRIRTTGDAATARTVELEGRRKNGEEFPLELSLSAWTMGGERFFTGMIRDVTERRRAEDALRDSEARLRVMVDHVPAVVYTADPAGAGAWRYASPSIQALLGFTPEEWLAEPVQWCRHLHPEDRERVVLEYEALARARSNQSRSIEYRMCTRHGQVIWVRDDATMVTREGRAVSRTGVLMDITERKTLEEQLAHQAFHDSLTGLANRVLFRDRAAHALVRSKRDHLPIAVLFVDLDEFKAVNDRLGHLAGDRLLTEVAARLTTCLRDADTVARLGGDEFAVLLDSSARRAPELATRLLAALEEPFVVDEHLVTIGASVGVAIADGDAADADELLRNADVALYSAKGSGKHRIEVFEPSMHAAVIARLELAADLQRAVDDEQIVLHYQPIVELATNRIVGVEALARWHRPGRGDVPPSAFIPLAEETDAIVKLGRSVLHRACRQVLAWQLACPGAPSLSVGVNLSPRQLQHPDLVRDVAAILEDTGLPPQLLTLEITESMLLQDTEQVVLRLHQLADLGIRLAIDDFGTGYSSLSYLQRLPISTLKIDKSFVDGVGSDAEGRLLGAIVQLGETMGLDLVAEGIETAAQLAKLHALGCPHGQGYFFSRPLDPASMEAHLRLAQVAPGVPVAG